MIKLTKGETPNILQKKSELWKNELLDYIQRDESAPDRIKNRYNHDEIKKALKLETNSKCMYCESKVDHVSYEHIEHIKPKAKDKFPELTFEWSNLGLACPICNGNKSDYYDVELSILNPYEDDLAEFIFACGAFIFHKPGKDRGKVTVSCLNLNRPELLERRKERIDNLLILLDKFESTKHDMLRKIIYKEISHALQADKEYSLILNSTRRSAGLN